MGLKRLTQAHPAGLLRSLFLRGGCDGPLPSPGQPGRGLPSAGNSTVVSGEESIRRAWGRAVPSGHTVAVACPLQRKHNAPTPKAVGPNDNGPARTGGTQTPFRAWPRPRPECGRPWTLRLLVRVCVYTGALCVGARRGYSSLFLFSQIRKYSPGCQTFPSTLLAHPRPAQGPDKLLPVLFAAQLPPLTLLDVGTRFTRVSQAVLSSGAQGLVGEADGSPAATQQEAAPGRTGPRSP